MSDASYWHQIDSSNSRIRCWVDDRGDVALDEAVAAASERQRVARRTRPGIWKQLYPLGIERVAIAWIAQPDCHFDDVGRRPTGRFDDLAYDAEHLRTLVLNGWRHTT